MDHLDHQNLLFQWGDTWRAYSGVHDAYVVHPYYHTVCICSMWCTTWAYSLILQECADPWNPWISWIRGITHIPMISCNMMHHVHKHVYDTTIQYDMVICIHIPRHISMIQMILVIPWIRGIIQMICIISRYHIICIHPCIGMYMILPYSMY